MIGQTVCGAAPTKYTAEERPTKCVVVGAGLLHHNRRAVDVLACLTARRFTMRVGRPLTNFGLKGNI